MHCSSPAPIASLWLATALMRTRVERRAVQIASDAEMHFSGAASTHLVVTMVPRLWMDFLSPSVSITRSNWSFSSG